MITAQEALEKSKINEQTETDKLEKIWQQNKEIIFARIEASINNVINSGKFMTNVALDVIVPSINKWNYKDFFKFLKRDLEQLGYEVLPPDIEGGPYIISWKK